MFFLFFRNNARYLWKRIPPAIKSVSSGPNLTQKPAVFVAQQCSLKIWGWKWVYTYGQCREYSSGLTVWGVFFWSQQANAELGAVWSVGQRIWQRDFPGIYAAISAHQWSETIQPIMEALRGTNWACVGNRELPGIISVCSNTNRQIVNCEKSEAVRRTVGKCLYRV